MAMKMSDENFRNSCREICYETMESFRRNNLKKPIIRFEEQANVLEAVAQLYIAANTPSFEKKTEKINYYGEKWTKGDA